MSLINFIDIKTIGDSRGYLVALEGERNIPFPIKRVYYLTAMNPDLPRGFHAHKKLSQVAICLHGKCRMILDNGIKKEEVWLDSFSKAIRIEPMIWHEMHDFSVDCVFMVLASDYYDESDYIRDYDNFLNHINS